MNFRKAMVFIGVGLLGLIILAYLGLGIWAWAGTYEAGDVAMLSMKSSNDVEVIVDEWIVFEPKIETEIGLIFYPGGLVEPEAYSPILKEIAENGVFVVITPMPFNLAILNTGQARHVIEAFPEISTWYIAGHSLGGTSAAIFAENNPDIVEGIAIWDSYPSDGADLSNNDIHAIVVYGTTNGIPNTENLYDKKFLLPDNTEYVSIEGANHAQFGDYGFQKGDIIAQISPNEQHAIVVEIMLEFLLGD